MQRIDGQSMVSSDRLGLTAASFLCFYEGIPLGRDRWGRRERGRGERGRGVGHGKSLMQMRCNQIFLNSGE